MEQLTRGVAAHGLAGTTLTLPDRPLDEERWATLAQAVRYQRLGGLLAAAVTSGALAATHAQAREASDDHARAMSTCLLSEATLLEVTAALDRAGTEHRVLKGSAVAHLDYADPSLRCFGDVDLLVRSEQFDRAVAVLEGHGWERRFPQPRSGFDRRFSKGTSFQKDGRGELDLHRTFVMGPFGLTVDLADLWSATSPLVVGGRVLHVLAPEERFLHACFHAALGNTPPRLGPLRDVAEMLQPRHPPLDVDRIRALAAHWRADTVLARAVNVAAETLALGPTAISEWAAGVQPDKRERRALATYLDPDLGYAARSLAAVRVIPGLHHKAAFVWSLAVPGRDYLAGRHGGWLRRWRAAGQEIMQARRRAC